jgi:hypothetical protein
MLRRNTTLRTFLEEWSAAEMRGDVTSLRHLLDDTFVGVAEDGVVLKKPAWLERYGSGELVNNGYCWRTTDVRYHRRTALVVGHLDRASSYRGHDASRVLTVTLAVAYQRDSWRLLGFHASGTKSREERSSVR